MVPPGTAAGADRTEVTEACWVAPDEALRRAAAGEWRVEFPTRQHLEALAAHRDAAAVVAAAPGAAGVVRVQPRLTVEAEGTWRVLLPGEVGYEEAPA